jgi:hypothetical protein
MMYLLAAQCSRWMRHWDWAARMHVFHVHREHTRDLPRATFVPPVRRRQFSG